MALFKIEKGLAQDLVNNRPNAVEGYCYFTTDDGLFYIDTKTGTLSGENKTGERVLLNSGKSNSADKDSEGNKISTTYAKGSELSSHIENTNNPHNVTKEQLNLQNVENKSSSTIRSELTSDNIASALGVEEIPSVVTSGSYDDLTNKPITTFFTAVLGTEWTGTTAPYTQILTVDGLKTTDVPIVDIIISEDFSTAQEQTQNFSNIYKISITAENTIKVYSKEKTTIPLNLRFRWPSSVANANTPDVDVSGKEEVYNKVTTLSSASTDAQYPSAKCVYDIVGNIQEILQEIRGI